MARRAGLVLKDAEKARDAITKAQQKEIRDLYSRWAKECEEMADYYATKTTWSAEQQRLQLLDLQRRLTAQSHEVSKEINGSIRNNIYVMADQVCKANEKLLRDLGFTNTSMAFRSVPDSVVRKLVTGQVYDTGWSLSKAIWSDNQQALHDIYGIVARGRAMNTSIYDIAKQLEAYVNPDRRKPWNLTMKDGVRIYKHQVDYNAQRLARTLIQHSYQQSVIETTKNNPFVTGYRWIANGSRVCPLCMDRNGQIYTADDLPLDHPNGQCVMEPVIDMDSAIDRMADWFNGEKGDFPEIDEFAKELGYNG